MGFITPSQNWPKLNFSVGVINPRGIPIPKGIEVKSEKLVYSHENFNSQRGLKSEVNNWFRFIELNIVIH